MTAFGLLIALHIVCVTLAYGAHITSDLWVYNVARAGNAAAFRIASEISRNVARFSGILFLVGIVAGLILVGSAGYSYMSPWLMWTYGLLIAGTIVVVALTVSWRIRLMKEIQDMAGTDADAAVCAAAKRQRLPLGAVAGFVVMAAIVWLMAAKP